MKKRLCACVNIFPNMIPLFFWPPKSDKIMGSKETTLIIKSLEKNYQKIENEVHKIHSYQVPCVLALPIAFISKKYLAWMRGEIK